ncbi:hypothetical protein TOPH_02557 [Tolypocladium ophioglossoides CBS 100239]|uniref:Uncharacterized protein n=1 Tax=Tolypocladium ophioglossoides (strain CBS 100239) TaxID=1163406 RepID=A0A0L0NFN4_TOLOC|nr:hypothetical protein TOPH_02557 [Tolypocladium ophioglossoides CBS 100239]
MHAACAPSASSIFAAGTGSALPGTAASSLVRKATAWVEEVRYMVLGTDTVSTYSVPAYFTYLTFNPAVANLVVVPAGVLVGLSAPASCNSPLATYPPPLPLFALLPLTHQRPLSHFLCSPFSRPSVLVSLGVLSRPISLPARIEQVSLLLVPHPVSVHTRTRIQHAYIHIPHPIPFICPQQRRCAAELRSPSGPLLPVVGPLRPPAVGWAHRRRCPSPPALFRGTHDTNANTLPHATTERPAREQYGQPNSKLDGIQASKQATYKRKVSVRRRVLNRTPPVRLSAFRLLQPTSGCGSSLARLRRARRSQSRLRAQTPE